MYPFCHFLKVNWVGPLVLIVAVTFSCVKSETDDPTSRKYFGLFSNESIPDVQNAINISYIQERNVGHTLSVFGEFYNESGSLNPSGFLNISGWEIPLQNGFFQREIFESQSDFDSVVYQFIGNNLEISYDWHQQLYTSDFYCPKSFDVSFDQDLKQLDRTRDLMVSWDIDTASTFPVVSLALVSRGVDGEVNETTSQLHITEITTDDGSHTFKAVDFSNWPLDLDFDVIAIRGQQAYEEETKTLVTYLNFNYSSGTIRY